MNRSVNLSSRLTRGLSWTLGANLLIGLINLIGQIWFARVLGVKVIGQYASLVVALELGLMVVKFGFNQAVIRYRNDLLIYNGALTLILIQAFITLIIALALFAGFHLIYPDLAIVLFFPGLLLVLARILNYFLTFIYAPLESELKYRYLSTMRLISALIGFLVAGSLLFIGGGIYTLVIRDIMTTLLLLILVWYRVRPNFSPNFTSKAIKPVWKFSVGVWGLNMLERSSLRLDYALVGIILGRDALGIYFQVRALVEGVLGFLLSPIQTVIYSFYCTYSDRDILFNRVLKRGNLIVVLVAIISMIFMFFIGKSLIIFILGDMWKSGGELLPGLILYAWSLIWFENIKAMAMSKNIHHLTIWARIFQIIALTVLVVPLTKILGFIGAGAATGFAAILLACSSTVLLSRKLRVELVHKLDS